MNRRNWLLTAGGIFAATYIPTKTYSFLSDNPLRDDSAWLSRQEYVEGKELIIKSPIILKNDLTMKNCQITYGDDGSILVANNNYSLYNSKIIYKRSKPYISGKYFIKTFKMPRMSQIQLCQAT